MLCGRQTFLHSNIEKHEGICSSLMDTKCFYRRCVRSPICFKHANEQRFNFRLNQMIALNTRDKIFAVAILQYRQSTTTPSNKTLSISFWSGHSCFFFFCSVKCVKFNTTHGLLSVFFRWSAVLCGLRSNNFFSSVYSIK